MRTNIEKTLLHLTEREAGQGALAKADGIVLLPDIDVQVREVIELIRANDVDQATLTSRYIEAGRRLSRIRETYRDRHGQFQHVLASIQEETSHARSTLYDYMKLAKFCDAANEVTKVQLAGLFKHGWGAVLGEFRTIKRRESLKLNQPAINHNIEDLQILEGDCMARLDELPNDSADCGITSIPYFRQVAFSGAKTVIGGSPDCEHDWELHERRGPTEPRSINRTRDERQSNVIESGTCRKCNAQRIILGQENTPAEYVSNIVTVLEKVKRVLKPKGLFYLNVGDTYRDRRLQLIPARLVVALDDAGWIVRNDPIWQVLGRAPEGKTDRFERDHEYVFVLAKQTNHYFDSQAVRVPTKNPDPRRSESYSRRVGRKGMAGTWGRPTTDQPADGMQNRRTVWRVPIERVEGGHPAPFPRALVEPMVLSGCPKGGVCLDPFGGIGTTALVALAHGRKAILIEANPEYCETARRRIANELEPYKAELANRDGNEIAVVSQKRH